MKKNNRKLHLVISFGLALCLFSCKTLEPGEKHPGVCSFQPVPLEYKHANVKTEGFLPLFLDERLSGFNEVLSNFKDTCIKKYISDVAESYADHLEELRQYGGETGGMMVFRPGDFYYALDVSATYGNDFVSVVLSHSNYTGGAHGSFWTNTFTWDVSNNRLANIHDVTGYSSKEISEICIRKIRNEFYADLSDAEYNDDVREWVTSGAGVEQVDSFKFYVNGNRVFVRFDPYEVGCWAMGECVVQIK